MVEMRRFGEFASFKYGKMPNKEKLTDVGKYPVYSGYRYVGYYDEFNTEANQLIIVARGVGGTGDVKLTKERCYLTNLSISAEIDIKKVLPEFIYYYFLPRNLRYLDSGSAQSQITISDLEKVKIPIPPLDKQKAICRYMRMLDGKIEINQKVNENLFQQLLALYDDVSRDCDNARTRNLGELCRFQEGYVNPAQTHPEYFDGSVKWLRAVDINESFIIETSRTLTKDGFESAKKSAFLFSPNTIAISKSGTIGRLGIVADYMCGNRAVINISPKEPTLLPFVYSFLKSKQKEFPDLAVGSVQKNLYVSLLEPLEVMIPESSVLSRFCNLGNDMLNTIGNNCKENIRLEQIRDTLLPKLMSGELDVAELDL